MFLKTKQNNKTPKQQQQQNPTTELKLQVKRYF